MLVPRTRLLVWVAAVGLPCAVAGGAGDWVQWTAVGLVAALGLVALLDAGRGLGLVHSVEVRLPEVVRLAKDRPGAVPIRLSNHHAKPRPVRLGMAWPTAIQAADELWTELAPTGAGWLRLEWACTARRRGCYRLALVRVETPSPLGFWAVRATQPVQAELRVYPNLQRDRRQLAGLFLHRTGPGAHAQRQVGKGREFEQLRDYIPGDSFEDIHWKATAKRGRPVTKLFQIERTQEVYVVIDFSRLSARPAGHKGRGETTARPRDGAGQSRAVRPAPANRPQTQPSESEPALERFLSAALLLGLVAEQQGDLFGLITFADKVETFVRAGSGLAHYDVCREALYRLEPQSVSPDFDEVATFIRLRLRRRVLLMFLTALDDPVLAEGFVRALDLIGRQHVVRVHMLQPPGVRPLFSNPDVTSLADLYEELSGHLQWQRLRQLQKVLQRRGAPLVWLDPARLSADLAAQYLNVKRRQLL